MPETCAAAFNPKVWTCATTPRKWIPSFSTCGITSPGAALCAARAEPMLGVSSAQDEIPFAGFRLTSDSRLMEQINADE